MKEIFKDIEGYEGQYQISNLARVKSLARRSEDGRQLKDKILNQRKNNVGYVQVVLYKKGIGKKTFLVHRLVAKAFIPNPENKPQVNHIDGVKTNNLPNNLEWCTASENVRHGFENNLYKNDERLQNHIRNAQKKAIEGQKIKIEQICLQTGKILNEFDSARDATRYMTNGQNENCSNIIAVCKGRRKQTYGFGWRYKK